MKRDEFKNLIKDSLGKKLNNEVTKAREASKDEVGIKQLEKLLAEMMVSLPLITTESMVETFEKAGFIHFDD